MYPDLNQRHQIESNPIVINALLGDLRTAAIDTPHEDASAYTSPRIGPLRSEPTSLVVVAGVGALMGIGIAVIAFALLHMAIKGFGC